MAKARWLLLLLVTLASALLSACSGSASEETKVIDTQPSVPARAGELGPRYAQPIPVTTGDYWPADFDYSGVSDRAYAVSSQGGLAFSGEVAGIRLIPIDQMDLAPKRPCRVASFPEVVHMQFVYLPPGTSLESPQYEGRCADGTITGVSQSFVTKRGATFVVGNGRLDKVLVFSASPDRVRTEKINGKEALVIDPVTPEGVGQSLVAISTDKGFIYMTGDDIPVNEFIKVLSALKCGDC